MSIDARMQGFGALLAIGVLAGCSGEDRPFEEAVELRQSGVTSLSIIPPEGRTQVPLVIGVGEQIDLGLVARGLEPGEIEFDDTDRDWRVVPTGSASIDGNGVVTGLADDMISVSVQVGAVSSAAFSLRVSGQPLTGIATIQGSAMPDPCLATRYIAMGQFADQSTRPLTLVDWSLATRDQAELDPVEGATDTGSIDLVPAGPTTLTLTAESGGFSGSRTLSVPATLQSLRLPPSPQALRNGATLDLSATGEFQRDGTLVSLDVTDTVLWRVQGGGTGVSVSNTAPNEGRVTANETGNSTVQAVCGVDAGAEVIGEVVIGVNASSVDNGNGLAFQSGTRSLSAGGSGIQLRVSTGSRYDEDDDVTAEIIFSTDNPAVANVATSGPQIGFVTPGLTAGTATIFARRGTNQSAFVNITVR